MHCIFAFSSKRLGTFKLVSCLIYPIRAYSISFDIYIFFHIDFFAKNDHVERKKAVNANNIFA